MTEIEKLRILRIFQDNSKNPLKCPICPLDDLDLITGMRGEGENEEAYLYCFSCNYVLLPGFNTLEKVIEEVREIYGNHS